MSSIFIQTHNKFSFAGFHERRYLILQEHTYFEKGYFENKIYWMVKAFKKLAKMSFNQTKLQKSSQKIYVKFMSLTKVTLDFFYSLCPYFAVR
jgi:RNA polymerase Rpb5, N-terminal domain